ncbi:5-dehydro-4-deoxyglucarate dehydratase [Mesorhizobium sp. M1D.F.Ca.ET.043.01.1.1]|uniref:5-dehydro-4-deoxyglucarate dehydratase n=1 Tax=Mesorhizobium sp. M1D.F.Ca.ET.043.01.1.1 TaxID=2493669 RepID=UPI001673A59F|nr:5-dehydro-4-deoxyglucarate dehydratase [Mesorhizobium sp. M1D.F.Ca.ET.043.01.1.1]
MSKNQINEGLSATLQTGVLSFPITDYSSDGSIDVDAYARRLEWMNTFGPAAIFPGAGAGEFFSLSGEEYDALLETAIETRGTSTPVIASVGYNAQLAAAGARRAEAIGADGILLMPSYMTRATQDGLFNIIRAVCDSVEIGVIVYNRGTCELAVETIQRLADACSNFVGVKDGHGKIETILSLRLALAGRLLLINGMPTAEMFAYSYAGMGIPTFSSGVFNFVPAIATAFQHSLANNDRARSDEILREFYAPYSRIRGDKPGYAVTILRAGATIIGRPAGLPRPPLVDITPFEFAQLEALIERTANLVA